jgi:hypothetical protein
MGRSSVATASGRMSRGRGCRPTSETSLSEWRLEEQRARRQAARSANANPTPRAPPAAISQPGAAPVTGKRAIPPQRLSLAPLASDPGCDRFTRRPAPAGTPCAVSGYPGARRRHPLSRYGEHLDRVAHRPPLRGKRGSQSADDCTRNYQLPRRTHALTDPQATVSAAVARRLQRSTSNADARPLLAW